MADGACVPVGRRKWARALLLVLIWAVCATATASSHMAFAANAITVSGTPTVDNKFPAEVVFNIDAASTAGSITDVTFHYQLLPTGNPTSGRPDFQPAASIQAAYHMRTAGNPLYLPPTKVVRYFWSMQDSAGNQLQTDPVDWMYQDTRFQFKTVTSGNLTLFYFNGSDANAKHILDVGRAALDKAGALDGAPLDFPIHLVTYGTQVQAQPALSHESPSTDPNILGQADAPDIVVLVAGDLSGADNEDTVRHELTHLVNSRAVDGRQTLPLWLDEGLAVYGQKDPGGFGQAVDQAIRQNKVVPIRNLAPSLRGTDAGLFYGEAWSIVNFLVKSYGQEKFAQLMAAFKSGASEDAAFTKAYGLDRDGVYNTWRKSVGLAEVAAPAAVPSQAPASNPRAAQPAAPTIPGGADSNTAPAAPQSGTNTSSGSDNSTVIVVAIAGGLALLCLLGAAVVGGLALSRRGRPG